MALKNDAVARVRRLVQACRALDERRKELRAIIVEGNASKSWGELPLPLHQLLKDVDTRWSSTFLMIDRALTLYLVRGLIFLFAYLSDQTLLACERVSQEA